MPLSALPLPELVSAVPHTTNLPLVAAEGIGTPLDVATALRAGAEAAMVGTCLLRTEKSGASAPHKQALADPAFDTTVLTRAFTGWPARALRNSFVDRHEDDAPVGSPAVHHLTAPLRRAATAAGYHGLIHLWAGTGHRQAAEEPTARTLRRRTASL
ncbi:nitronate monooxygenase [Streptomyces sp. NPDC086783]|uniref:nitronate monooxygenase n=1 Tax=Streptomyces sp. NPDC086783 TaxID=3365758 RepID=UPI00382E1381